jgi:hypothetical protein
MGISFHTCISTEYGLSQAAITQTVEFYLLPLTFAGAFLGSPLWTYLADEIGVLNVVLSTTLIDSCLIYGFFSSGFSALTGPMFALISECTLKSDIAWA